MTGKRMAAVMAVLLGAYLLLSASRAIDFIQAGGIVPVMLGVAILAFPVIGLWVLWREWQFGRATEALGHELAARGELPLDDLPRRPSGRPSAGSGRRPLRRGAHPGGGRPRLLGALVRALDRLRRRR